MLSTAILLFSNVFLIYINIYIYIYIYKYIYIYVYIYVYIYIYRYIFKLGKRKLKYSCNSAIHVSCKSNYQAYNTYNISFIQK